MNTLGTTGIAPLPHADWSKTEQSGRRAARRRSRLASLLSIRR